MTKTHNWVEWTAPSVYLSQTKVNDINLNDRPQMQNDTKNLQLTLKRRLRTTPTLMNILIFVYANNKLKMTS